MIDWTKPLRTKDGREARVISEIKNYPYLRVVIVNITKDIEQVYAYTEDGMFQVGEPTPILDLKNVSEKKVLWLPLYKNESEESLGYYTGLVRLYDSEEKAKKTAPKAFKIVKIEIED